MIYGGGGDVAHCGDFRLLGGDHGVLIMSFFADGWIHIWGWNFQYLSFVGDRFLGPLSDLFYTIFWCGVMLIGWA